MRTVAGGRRQQAREEHRERGLARARAPDDGERLARAHTRSDTSSSTLRVPYAKLRCVDTQRAADVRCARRRAVDDLGLGVEDVAQARRTRRARAARC